MTFQIGNRKFPPALPVAEMAQRDHKRLNAATPKILESLSFSDSQIRLLSNRCWLSLVGQARRIV
jgi:hypothetical protein